VGHPGAAQGRPVAVQQVRPKYRHKPGTPWKQYDHVDGYEHHLTNSDLAPTEPMVKYLADLSGGDPAFIRRQTKAEVAFAIDAWKKKLYIVGKE